jgi:hypothetical protein
MLTHNSPPCHSALLRRSDQIATFILPLLHEVGNIQFFGNFNSQSALSGCVSTTVLEGHGLSRDVSSFRDSPHKLSLPGTDVPGYRPFRP